MVLETSLLPFRNIPRGVNSSQARVAKSLNPPSFWTFFFFLIIFLSASRSAVTNLFICAGTLSLPRRSRPFLETAPFFFLLGKHLPLILAQLLEFCFLSGLLESPFMNRFPHLAPEKDSDPPRVVFHSWRISFRFYPDGPLHNPLHS